MSGASFSENGSSLRRVLVLAGGGAKGAYAFGCMLAFARAKIRFKAVAGTSVGALNAILWSTNSMSSGIALWRSISFSSVYPVRFCDPRQHSRTFIRLFAAVYVFCRLLWAKWQGTPTPGQSLFRALLALMFWFPLPFCLIQSPKDEIGHIVRDTLILALWLWICWMGLDGNFKRKMILLAVTIPSYLMFLGDRLMDFAGHFILSRWLDRLVVGLLLALVVLCCLAAFLILSSLFALDKSVLASSKLRESISNVISRSRFYVPAFVTIARERDVFDPDSPRWQTNEVDQYGVPQEGCLWYPETVRTWQPIYVDLTRIATEDAIQCCLASAAIPFGIVPPIKLGQQTYVDGGTADNCPVYPFLNRDDVDEIFMVLLSPYKSDDAALQAAGATVKEWQERKRQTEVAEFPIPKSVYGGVIDAPSHKRNRPPTVLPYSTPKPFPVCIPFYPSTSLGNFMSGTLNFSGLFATRSICRGYADTRLRLQNLGYWPLTKPL